MDPTTGHANATGAATGSGLDTTTTGVVTTTDAGSSTVADASSTGEAGDSTDGATTGTSDTTTGDGTTTDPTETTTAPGEVCDDEPLADTPMGPCAALATQAECERAGCTFVTGLRFTAEDCQCVKHGWTEYCVPKLADICSDAPMAYYRVHDGVAEVMVRDQICSLAPEWLDCKLGGPPELCDCGCPEGSIHC